MLAEPKLMEQLPHEPQVECKKCNTPKIKVAKAFICCPKCDKDLIETYAVSTIRR